MKWYEVKRIIRCWMYHYVMRRIVAWHNGELDDQELTDAMYLHDIYHDMPKGKKADTFKEDV